MANGYKKQAKDMYKTRKAYKPENESGLEKDVEKPTRTLYETLSNLYKSVIGRNYEPKRSLSANYNTSKYSYKNKIKDNPKKASGLEKDVEQPLKRTFYERIENPDYGPTKRSSLAVSAMGGLLLAAGLATGIYPLAYIGATLGLGSLGYYSGHRRRAKQLDQWYTKVEGLEDKVLEPYENKTLYEDKYVSQKEVDELWKKKHPWYWRLLGVNDALRMSNREPKRYTRYTIIYAGYLQFAALIGMTLLGIGLRLHPPNPAYILPGLSMLATGFASRIGFYHGKRSATPEYREVKGLEKKLKELPLRKKADKPPQSVVQW